MGEPRYQALSDRSGAGRRPGLPRWELIGWYVVVPVAALAFLTGLIMSLGTPWGLIHHYWVVLALTLTAVALAVLLVHMPTVTAAAGLARTASDPIVATLGGEVVHPALGLAVLVVIAVLNIYKPRGVTGYGRAPRPARVLPHRGQRALKPVSDRHTTRST